MNESERGRPAGTSTAEAYTKPGEDGRETDDEGTVLESTAVAETGAAADEVAVSGVPTPVLDRDLVRKRLKGLYGLGGAGGAKIAPGEVFGVPPVDPEPSVPVPVEATGGGGWKETIPRLLTGLSNTLRAMIKAPAGRSGRSASLGT